MYLSRLILNPRSSEARRDLADCYELHRTVMSGFDDLSATVADARARLGVLYRVELDPRTGRSAILVQSRPEPTWLRLPRGYLLTTAEHKPIDRALASIACGDRLTFRLRANPTRRISKNNPKEERRWWGQRVNLRDEAAWLEWLARKADHGGFRPVSVQTRDDVLAVQTSGEEKIRGGGGGPNDRRRPLTFASVLFEGRLEVVDADRFRSTLAEGIGTGKAFGFGLLSIARAG